MPASLKSLSMPADDTGTLKTIFAQIFSLPSLLSLQKTSEVSHWYPAVAKLLDLR